MIDFVAYLSIYLLAAIVYHLLIGFSIKPYLLDKKRFQLFELRDRLRKIELKSDLKIDPKIYSYYSHAINFSIKHISYMNVKLVTRIIIEELSLEEDEHEIRNQAREELENSTPEELLSIHKDFQNVNNRILFINSLHSLIYLPVILLVGVFTLAPIFIYFLYDVAIFRIKDKSSEFFNNLKKMRMSPTSGLLVYSDRLQEQEETYTIPKFL